MSWLVYRYSIRALDGKMGILEYFGRINVVGQ